MACNCTDAFVGADDYDDAFTSKYTVSTVHTASADSSDASSDASRVLNTSYRSATPLFREIEKENWEGVLRFLTTGKWSNSLLLSTNEHLKSPAPALQVKTWVTAYDVEGVPEWSQLPLHAAISYGAPYVVISKLIDLYPKSIQCTDNEGMLPIHLAFGFGASEAVISILLEHFPSSINERGLGGRYPYECCELGPNKARGEVFRVVSEQLSSRVRLEVDSEWKRFVRTACMQMKLDYTPLRVEDRSLEEFIAMLLKDRKELIEIKEAAKKASQDAILDNRSRATAKPHRTERVAPPKGEIPCNGTGTAQSYVEEQHQPPSRSHSSSHHHHQQQQQQQQKQQQHVKTTSTPKANTASTNASITTSRSKMKSSTGGGVVGGGISASASHITAEQRSLATNTTGNNKNNSSSSRGSRRHHSREDAGGTAVERPRGSGGGGGGHNTPRAPSSGRAGRVASGARKALSPIKKLGSHLRNKSTE